MSNKLRTCGANLHYKKSVLCIGEASMGTKTTTFNVLTILRDPHSYLEDSMRSQITTFDVLTNSNDSYFQLEAPMEPQNSSFNIFNF